MTSYIIHAALGPADGAPSSMPRTAVPAAAIEACADHIARALDSGSDPVPGLAGYATAMRIERGVLIATVGRQDDKTALCTFAVVTRSKHAAKAWRALHEGYPEYAGSLDAVPAAPYCAVRAEPGLAYDQGAGQWLDAYQIAVAWAWIDRSMRAH